MMTHLGLKCWRWSALLLASVLLAACGGSAPTGKVTADWLANPDDAMQTALQQNRPLMIVFLGLDWSVASQNIMDDVFNTPAFKNFADNNLVLLRVDLARKPESDKVAQMYQKLAENQQIDALPVCLLYDVAHHNTFGRFNGYGMGGPMPFMQAVKSRLDQWQQMLAQQPPAGSSGPLSAPPTMSAPLLPPVLSAPSGNSPSPTPEQLMQQIQQQAPQPSAPVAPLPTPATPSATNQPLLNLNALK